MTARDEAVEAAAVVLHTPTRPTLTAQALAQVAIDAALPVLLDGLDREALYEFVMRWLYQGIDGHRAEPPPREIQDDLYADAQNATDAVIAYLRDEWSA